MSWLYSQALVAEYLEGSCSDGAPFAPSSGAPTPQAYLPPDKMTDFSRPSRFGMTFAPLTDDRGEELLTWFLAGFRARTSARQEKALGLTESAAGCGARWQELSVKYDPDSCSWKTHLCLWGEDLPESSVILPRWGLMRNGVCLERMTLAHRTAANDAGLWATPSATDGKRGGTITENMTGVSLAQMVKTPMRWPTPTAMTNTGGSALCKWGDSGARAQLRKMVTPQELNGALNPVWVEWLMGWPQGWTDLRPLETDKCRNAQRRHGGF